MYFEYKVDSCWGENSEHEDYLNKMGKDRWELIGISLDGGTFKTYTFKRVKELNLNKEELEELRLKMMDLTDEYGRSGNSQKRNLWKAFETLERSINFVK